MTKDEVMLDDKFDDEKMDCQDVEKLDLQEDDDSPIEEVRVTVPSEYQTSFLMTSPLLSTRLYFDTPSSQLSTLNLLSSPTLPLVSFIHLLYIPPAILDFISTTYPYSLSQSPTCKQYNGSSPLIHPQPHIFLGILI